MHIRYVQAERTEMIYDKETSDMLDKKMDMKIVAKKFIENLRQTVEELQSEKKTLTEKGARFGSFLKHNAILTHNEAIKEYLEIAIREAKRISVETGDSRQAEGLVAALQQYEQQKKIIEYCIANGTEKIEAIDIKRDYKQLFALKHSGQNLKSLFEAEELGQKNQFKYTENTYNDKQQYSASRNYDGHKNESHKNYLRGASSSSSSSTYPRKDDCNRQLPKKKTQKKFYFCQEYDVINRKAFGNQVSIGCLYDVNTDCFVTTTLLEAVNSHQSNSDNELKFEFLMSPSLSDKLNLLEVETEQQISILSEMTQHSFFVDYLKNFTLLKTSSFTLIFKINTKHLQKKNIIYARDSKGVVYVKGGQALHSLINNHAQNITYCLLFANEGVGKSTWINTIFNYLCHTSLADAFEDPICVIPSRFAITNKEMETQFIHAGIPDEKNESTNAGKSFCFVDTPGTGDTAGSEKDKVNLRNTIRYISELEEVQGICIVMKPNEARLSVAFQYCIGELLTHLHKDAAANIVYCFTNTSGNHYTPGIVLSF
uniref:G domain-containing protein n=1 Tax=Ditylenchus dipsaci TaxID=166011 RepID=A0A915E569_9BILA